MKTPCVLRKLGESLGDSDHLTHDGLHILRRGRGNARKDSKAVLKARVSTMDAVARKRASEMEDATDTPEDTHVTQEKRSLVDVAKEHAHWRDPEMNANWDATLASPLEGGGCCDYCLAY